MKLTVLFVLLFFCGCQKPASPVSPANVNAAPAFRSPSASEIFDLRSKCAELGEKIAKNKVPGDHLQKDELSHYDPKTNRCYVRLTVRNANLGKGDEDFQQYLFDGQTGQVLAMARREHGVRSGDIYSDPPPSAGNPDEMYVDASLFISQMMADDRQQ